MSATQRFKDAALTALVALALAFPLLGFQTADTGDGYITRFNWVAIATAAAFAGRMLLGLVPQRFHLRQYSTRYTALSEGKAVTLAAAALILFAIVLPFSPFGSRRTVDLATLALIYVILGWGLNIVVGLAGLLDLGYVAFYAVGAYSFGLAAEWYGLSFWEMLPVAGAIAAVAGILLGLPVLRLRGDYLAIVTLGFGEIVRIVLNNWSAVTNGPNGIGDIPRPTVFGMPISPGAPAGMTSFNHFFGVEYDPLQRLVWLYYVCLAAALVINWFSLRIRRLPVGRAWEALREDEIACRALGLNPHTIKLTAFATGAMLGGFAGAIFCDIEVLFRPDRFNLQVSVCVMSIVVLGCMFI
ncbi:MAG: high-affinity branched-chain amino acid ABC transporter permease LivM, partial [Stellaceae bacterium]